MQTYVLLCMNLNHRGWLKSTLYSTHKQSPPHRPGYYSFSQPIASDPISSVLSSRLTFLPSAPSICPSSDYIPRQSDANAHLNFPASTSSRYRAFRCSFKYIFLNIPYFSIRYSASSGRYRSR